MVHIHHLNTLFAPDLHKYHLIHSSSLIDRRCDGALTCMRMQTQSCDLEKVKKLGNWGSEKVLNILQGDFGFTGRYLDSSKETSVHWKSGKSFPSIFDLLKKKLELLEEISIHLKIFLFIGKDFDPILKHLKKFRFIKKNFDSLEKIFVQFLFIEFFLIHWKRFRITGNYF